MSGVAPGPGVVYAKKTKVLPIFNPDLALGDEGVLSKINQAKQVKDHVVNGQVIPKERRVSELSEEIPESPSLNKDKPALVSDEDEDESKVSIGKEEEENKDKIKPVLNDNSTSTSIANKDKDMPATTMIPQNSNGVPERTMETRPRGARQLLKFKCPTATCTKSFPNKNTLDNHMTTHPDPEESYEYACAYCPKTFRMKQSLTNHEKSHTDGFQPYRCHKCPKIFTVRSSWFTHTNAVSCSDSDSAPPSRALSVGEGRRKQSFQGGKQELISTPPEPAKNKRQSATSATPPLIPVGKKHQIEQSGLPIKKRGRPVKVVRSASLSSEAESMKNTAELVAKLDQTESSIPDKPDDSNANEVVSVQTSPTSNGLAIETLKVEPESPEPTSRAQRKRNPPKWTENMVMDYDLSYVSANSRGNRTSESRKSSAEASSTETSQAGRSQCIQTKQEEATDSPKSITKNIPNSPPVKDETKKVTSENKGKVLRELKEVSSTKSKLEDSKEKVEVLPSSIASNDEIEKEDTLVPGGRVDTPELSVRIATNELSLKRKLRIPLKLEKIKDCSEEKKRDDSVKMKSELSHKTQQALIAKFEQAVIQSNQITLNRVEQPDAVTNQADAAKSVEKTAPIKSNRGRKRKRAKSSKVEVPISEKIQSPKKTSVEEMNTLEFSQPMNDSKSQETHLEEMEELLKSGNYGATFKVQELVPNCQDKDNDVDSPIDLNSTISAAKAEEEHIASSEEPPTKRIRTRQLQVQLDAKQAHPKIDIQESDVEKVPSESLPQIDSSPSTHTDKEKNAASTNGFGVPVTVPAVPSVPGVSFCGMPRLLNQSSIPPLEFVGSSDKSSDSEDDSAYADVNFMPPEGRRLSTEPYIKNEAIRFLANKISNRNMLRIRQELMLLKQSGNYFKLTKTAPLAAGLIHDMFCQTLDP